MELDFVSRYVIDTLSCHGHSAYAVGGAVRDRFLSRDVFDIDVATDALPQQTKEIFSSHRVVDIGIRHGTVTVMVDETPVEITTFRRDEGYSDNRHPDSVVFCDNIYDDLSRRDFTVNAMAFSPKEGLVDPFNGMEDLKNRVIRAVGDPRKRFCEDSLRILRGLRFASQLGFEIEESTYVAMLTNAGRVSDISGERVLDELKKLVLGDYAGATLTRYGGILERILPLSDQAFSVDCLPMDVSMRLACLFGEKSDAILAGLKCDTKTRRAAAMLGCSTMLPDTPKEIKNFVSRHGREDAKLIANYRRCLYREDLSGLVTATANSDQCLTLSELAVKGDDLISIGILGESVGKMLKKLLNFVLNGDCPNDKEVLLNRAKVIDNTKNV